MPIKSVHITPEDTDLDIMNKFAVLNNIRLEDF